MATLAFIVSAAAMSVLVWKVQTKILLYCVGAVLVVFGSLAILLLNFAKDQSGIGWLGNVGIYLLAVGFLAFVRLMINRRPNPASGAGPLTVGEAQSVASDGQEPPLRGPSPGSV